MRSRPNGVTRQAWYDTVVHDTGFHESLAVWNVAPASSPALGIPRDSVSLRGNSVLLAVWKQPGLPICQRLMVLAAHDRSAQLLLDGRPRATARLPRIGGITMQL